MRNLPFEQAASKDAARDARQADARPPPALRRARIGSLAFEIVSDRAGFDALEHDWNALFERSGLPHQLFQSFNWNWHWCNVFLDSADENTSLHIVIARRDGELVLVWPLIRDRRFGVTRLTFMGTPVTQYCDVLLADSPEAARWLAAAWRYLRETVPHDVICLQKVRSDAHLSTLIQDLAAVKVAEETAPYAPLGDVDDFESYASRFSRRKRKTWARLQRRMNEQGALSFVCLSEGEAAVKTVKLALDLKRDWLKARNLLSLAFADPRFDEFFLAVAAAKKRPVGLAVSKLSSGNTPAAIEIALACKGHHAAHIGAMNMELQQFKPGKMQTRYTIEHCLKKGMATYDLLPPGDRYKREWCESVVSIGDFAIANSLAGSAYIRLHCQALKPLVKYIRDTLPVVPGWLSPVRKFANITSRFALLRS